MQLIISMIIRVSWWPVFWTWICFLIISSVNEFEPQVIMPCVAVILFSCVLCACSELGKTISFSLAGTSAWNVLQKRLKLSDRISFKVFNVYFKFLTTWDFWTVAVLLNSEQFPQHLLLPACYLQLLLFCSQQICQCNCSHWSCLSWGVSLPSWSGHPRRGQLEFHNSISVNYLVSKG